MIEVTADFETANTAGVDLTEVGHDRYAQDLFTEVLCLVCKWTDPRSAQWRPPGEPQRQTLVWCPGDSTEPLAALASDPMTIWEAHGAGFEQSIWRYIMVAQFGLPPIPIKRWACTMAASLAKGCPASLEKAAKALGLAQQKDMSGSAITVALSKKLPIDSTVGLPCWMDYKPEGVTAAAHRRDYPNEVVYPRRTPEIMQRVIDYCDQDVETEHELSMLVGTLSPYERAVWEHDQLVQQRGIMIDVPFVTKAILVIRCADWAMRNKFIAATGLNPSQNAKFLAWVQAHGVAIDNLQKATIDKLIGKDDDERDGDIESVQALPDVPATVRECLEIRRLLGATSISKFPKMLEVIGGDHVARYLTQYHGAGTGRWAGRLFQPQNLIRLPVTLGDEPVDPEMVVGAIMTGDWQFVEGLFGMNALKVCGRATRHALRARDGHVFSSGDYVGIELCILLALAGEYVMCDMIMAGKSLYLLMAEDIYKQPRGSMSKVAHLAEYTIGKNTILGCGFGMGADTFWERYCPHMSLEFAKGVVNTYRTVTAPGVPKVWRGLEDAALKAAWDGFPHTAYGVTYEMHTSGMWLTCSLPDGQVMWYRNPVPVRRGEVWKYVKVPDGSTKPLIAKDDCWTYKAWKEGQWTTIQAYGGLLTENVVQKLARGLLVEAMWRLERHNWPVVLTVHDEILAEPVVGADQKEFEQLMSERPQWAAGLRIPVKVEGWQGPRYRK